MKLSILLLALTAAAFSSCTTAYKSGQTPDDVYFSPTREEKSAAYVQLQDKDDKYYRGSDDYYGEDRFLRMRMQDRYRWSALDDYYFYNTYAYNSYGYYNSWNNPWNSYYTWNNFYNPYYGGVHCYPGSVIIKNPGKYVLPSRAVAFNPNSYSTGNSINRGISGRSLNNGYNNTNSQRYNNRNNSNRSSFGESVRKVFSNSNSNGNYNSNSNNNSTPTRTYTPSSNSNSSSRSSSSGSSSSGSGSTRPPR